jgi:hypothetical protein
MSNRKQVRRFDSLDPARWMTVPFTRTTEGFLTGRAIVTGVGVFTYLNKDGSTTRELRLPEEVFSSESLASMKLKPVTNGHPDEKVTPENMRDFTVGSLGSNPSSTVQERSFDGYTPFEKLTDGFHVAIDMTVQRADAIEAVLNGKRALSMGYECEFESAEPGSVWCGMEYDGIQRNIRYNHCAVAASGPSPTVSHMAACCLKVVQHRVRLLRWLLPRRGYASRNGGRFGSRALLRSVRGSARFGTLMEPSETAC